MDKRFERFIKKVEPVKRGSIDYEESLFSNNEPTLKPKVSEETLPSQPQTLSLYSLYKEQGTEKWLENDNPIARASFNIINKTLYPERKSARGIAVLAAKGTSFPDKREACLELALGLSVGEATGEIKLVAEPKNPHDPNAVAIISVDTGKMIGYIPKALNVNKTYALALAEGKFLGGYIIETKRSIYKGEPNAMILLATGWL